MAEGVTFPIDITKTRLQLQGQADFTGTKLGFGPMMGNIFKTEGLAGLYAGVTPAVARHIPYTGFRAIGYEYIRAFFCGSAPKDQAPLPAKMAAGMTAGGVGQAIAVPCDLIKVRMQSDGRLVAAGKLDKPRYAGLFDAFTRIQAAEGIGGFYAGCWPAIQRAALVNLGELTTYDTAKKEIVAYTGDNLLCHLCSAICSGFVASLCSTPADVAKSRIMSQAPLPDGSMPYNGTLDCWRKVVATEGPMALYKGFMPGWLRLGPWQLVFWCSYEQVSTHPHPPCLSTRPARRYLPTCLCLSLWTVVPCRGLTARPCVRAYAAAHRHWHRQLQVSSSALQACVCHLLMVTPFMPMELRCARAPVTGV